MKFLTFVLENIISASMKTQISRQFKVWTTEWTNTYLEGFKISPKLRDPSSTASVNLMSLGAFDRSIASQPKQVEVVFHNDVSIDDELRHRVAAVAGLSPDDLQFGRHSIRLSVPYRYLSKLAAIDQVQHIEEYIAPQLFNNVAIGLLKADTVHTSLGFEGDGQVVAVADTGFDRGSTTDVHPAFTDGLKTLRIRTFNQQRS